MASNLQQAADLVAKMTADEKSRFLQLVANDVAAASAAVASDPEICGGEPRVRNTRIPIWILEQARRLGASEADILRSYPTLRAADLVIAWEYVKQHPKVIEEQILANENA